MTTDFRRLISDAFIISVSWFGAYFIRMELSGLFGYKINPLKNYVLAYPFILFFWMITAIYTGSYKKYGGKNISEIVLAFRAWIISSLISMSFAFLVREMYLSRSVLIIFSIICFLALTFKNYALSTKELRKAVLVGTGPLAIRIIQKIEDITNYQIKGIISLQSSDIGKKVDRYEVIGTLGSIGELIDSGTIDTLIFAENSLHLSAVMDIVSKFSDKTHMKFFIASSGFDYIRYGFAVEFVGDVPLVELGGFYHSPIYEFIKRTFDIIFSVAVLIITAPLFLVIAVAIKLDSPGPVFFTQERVGKNGKIFKIIKFRTMYKDVPRYSLSPRAPGDPRITKVGKFLRRFSLDELPQFINVVKGEMSVVGPRPEMPQIVQEYEPWQRERLKVRPGITGLWQILGRKDLPLEQNIQYDMVYIRNRSFLLDLIIILKTISIVITGRGAY